MEGPILRRQTHAETFLMKKRKVPPTKTYKRPAKKAKIAYNSRPAINTLMNEIGYFDAGFNTDATTTPTIVDLNNMAAGDDNITRDGNKIGMMAVGLRINYSLEAVSTNARCRFVVVLDKQSNAASPTWTGVFTAASIDSQRLIGSLSRYDILMDKVVTLNSTTTTATALQKGFFKKYLKMPNIIAAYAAGAASVPFTNGLTLMYISDIAAGAADVDVTGTARLYFNR